MSLRAKILVLSDAAAGGRREDRSGPVVRELLEKRGWRVEALDVLPDDEGRIQAALVAWTDGDDCDAVFTSGGTGLGLAISVEDARLHQGRLEAWGEPGQGACFRLTLPLIRGHKVTTSPLPMKPIPQAAQPGAETVVPERKDRQRHREPAERSG